MVHAPAFLTAPIFGNDAIRACLDDKAVAQAMVRVEVALASTQAAAGIVPQDAAQAISKLGASIDIQASDLAQGTATAGVPVPALLKVMRAELAPEFADWLHYGATSQDIIDTALCLCHRDVLDHLADTLGRNIDALEALSIMHRDTLMLGRTRGQLATPITFGLRVAQWAQPLIALEGELVQLRSAVLRVQLGGASGSRNTFGPAADDIAQGLANMLGLHNSAPWHTDRSGLGRLANWLGRLVEAGAKIGKDVGLSSRGEIGELRLTNGGGSSTMPHKSNPVTAEALQSLAVMALAYQAGISASAAHAEERDGVLWAAEWALLPMLCEVAGAAMAHTATLLAHLDVNTDTMRTRIDTMPEAKAEAIVFALAQDVGRVKAAKIVGQILTSGLPLIEALAAYPHVDWDTALSDSAFAEPAAQTAAHIFLARVAAG